MSNELRATEEVHVHNSIAETWTFIRNIGNWAAAMPGYKAFQPLSDDDSLWTIAAKIGPISREVQFEVNVRRWQEPTQVDFELTGRNEPFRGSGSYRAQAQAEGTLITLYVALEPSGPMAKMIGMLAGPVLRQGAKEFAQQLGKSLESSGCRTINDETPIGRRTRRNLAIQFVASCRQWLLQATSKQGR